MSCIKKNDKTIKVIPPFSNENIFLYKNLDKLKVYVPTITKCQIMNMDIVSSNA